MSENIARQEFRIGLIINPLAGVGGPLAYKGSDGEFIQSAARAMAEAELPALKRTKQFLQFLEPLFDRMKFVTVPGVMGEKLINAFNRPVQIVGSISGHTTARDTINGAKAIAEAKVDLLVFAGGDGTARDILTAVGDHQLVLGLPAGVKMHSGVFGVDPYATAQLVKALADGQLVGVAEQEVRDIDEDAFRQGVVKSKYFGTMLVPEENKFVQHVKQGGVEVDELVLDDIAAEIEERLDQLEGDRLIIFGSGSTVRFIQEKLAHANTLLGIDVADNDDLVLDVNEQMLFNLISSRAGASIRLLLTPIGGQGHIVGRGNQQISPRVLQAVGRENLWIVSTKSKLTNLEGRPLVLDTGNAELDREWSGLIPVITGYRQETLYALGYQR